MYLNDKVYISGPPPAYDSRDKPSGRLYIYTPATDTWDSIDTPVYNFALTTYHSQLVLVGGYNRDDRSPSAKLWTLSEDGQWQETLPPMETACIDASAVSHGDHLLVTHGDRDEVSVYNGCYWAKAQSMPERCYGMKSTVLNDNFYVMEMMWYGKVYSASLDSLIASCQPSETSQPSSIWKKLPDVPDRYCCPATFGGRLVAVGMSSIYAYDSSNQSWIEAGNTPIPHLSLFSAIGLPTNQLLVFSHGAVFKGSLKRKYVHIDCPIPHQYIMTMYVCECLGVYDALSSLVC